MDWNDETIARIRELWAEGHSTAEIGRRMEITKNAVVGKAHRLSLPPRPSPIRRSPAECPVTRRGAVRRGDGPTLPQLNAGILNAAPPSGPAARTAPARAPVVLRTVPAQPRPAGRVSDCCWPIGDPGTPSFHFCGVPAMGGKPYCTEHAALAYVKVRDRRDDAA